MHHPEPTRSRSRTDARVVLPPAAALAEPARAFEAGSRQTTAGLSSPGAPPPATEPLRVGGIDYLNSLPVLWGLESSGEGPGRVDSGRVDSDPRLRLDLAVPSRLAEGLHRGDLDVALVPIASWIELAEDCVVLPGIAIASHGAVRSIRVFHRRPLGVCGKVALDTSSRTSRLLTRLLFRELWGGEPEFVDLTPDRIHAELARGDDACFDAALLIGDAALQRVRAGVFESRDLGAEWTRWTGMPFVYAFWAARRDRVKDELASRLARRLARARDEGLLHLDEIVRGARLPVGFSDADARHYLLHAIRFTLGAAEIEALEHFFDRLADARILTPRPPRLSFVV